MAIKVRVIKEYVPHILPLGFETEVQSVPYEKDTELVQKQSRLNKQTGIWEVIAPAVVAPKGSHHHSTVIGIDGHTYHESVYHPYSLSDMFEKI